MTKAAHLLTSILFLIVCGAVWWLWKLGDDLLGQLLAGGVQSRTMTIAGMLFPWILTLPVLCILYSAVLMDRVELLPEKVLLYFVSISLISTVMVLGTLVLFTMEVAQMTLRLGGAGP